MANPYLWRCCAKLSHVAFVGCGYQEVHSQPLPPLSAAHIVARAIDKYQYGAEPQEHCAQNSSNAPPHRQSPAFV
jgi:hypothetical protein